MANAWPTPRPSSDPLDVEVAARNADGNTRNGPIPNSLDLLHVVDSLRASATDVRHDLETLLSGVTLAAFELAGATGVALALRTQGAVVCRARAGETAPPVGTQLDADSGISGACLRTGVPQLCSDTASDTRVDAEASRRLGVRSLAAVPLLDQGDVVGILEIFSDRPAAFTQSHVALLQHLAEIAVSGRNPLAESDAGMPAAPSQLELTETAVYPSPTFAAPWIDESAAGSSVPVTTTRWTGVRTGSAIAVLAVLIAIGWFAFSRGQSSTSSAHLAKAGTAAPGFSSSTSESLNSGAANADPAGQNFAPSRQKPAAGLNVAANDIVVPASSTTPLRRTAVIVVTPSKLAAGSGSANRQEEVAPPEVSQLADSSSGAASLPPAIVSSSAQLPLQKLDVSQGVTGGTLVYRVAPVYPKLAAARQIEGPVTLQGIVKEDGSIHDLKVLGGDPVLAQAALQAVGRWRYAPYLLNGNPVSMRTEITVQFKLQ